MGVSRERLMPSNVRAEVLPGRGLAQHQERAILNLGVYGLAALVCGMSPIAACAVLFGWAALKLRKRSIAANRPVARIGGPVLQSTALIMLIFGAALFALAMAPDLPRYSTPILVETLPPLSG